MVVDSAIVVIENIFTHLQQGKGPVRAAIDGTHEVWGALVGSSLTNVAVFLPLALVQGEVAQLFIDMTITMTAATGFSLLSAITIVPMLSGLFLSQSEALQVLSGDYSPTGNWMWRAIARSSAIFRMWQGRLEKGLLTTVTWGIGRGRLKQRLILLTIPLFLIGFSYFTLPPADYLPQGNRNQILWRAEPLPGTSIPESIALSQPSSNSYANNLKLTEPCLLTVPVVYEPFPLSLSQSMERMGCYRQWCNGSDNRVVTLQGIVF